MPDSFITEAFDRLVRMRAELDVQLDGLCRLNRQVAGQTGQARYDFASLRQDDWEELGARARAGELGSELRQAQRRIDDGAYTWNDVIAGNAPRDVVGAYRGLAQAMPMIAAGAEQDLSVEEFAQRLADRGIRVNLPDR